MTTTFQVGGARALRKVADLRLPRMKEGRLGLKLMPIVNVNETTLEYERNQVTRGLQFARGVGGSPGTVNKPGFESRIVSPGYYGDAYRINEQELVNKRETGSWTEFDSEGKQTGRASEFLTQRYLDRIEYNVFTFLLTGGFEAKNIQGVPYYQPVYDVNALTPGTLFSDLANSTPRRYLQDQIATLHQRGYSVRFDKGWMVMSSKTAITMLNNTNANDIGGRRFDVGQTANSFKELNQLFLANGIPEMTIYDEGYFPETGNFTLYVPEGKILLIGVRQDGEPIGEYRQTRNAYNPNSAPGEHYRVIDNRDREGPPEVVCEAGHNGGPVPHYPEAVAVINAY